MTQTIRIGTGGSDLAVARAGQVTARLGVHEAIRSPGDGAELVGALRAALGRGEVDVIVMPLDDVPPAREPGIDLVAVPKRADARDALCSTDGAGLAGLLPGARVGVSSERRRAQLLAARDDLEVVAVPADAAGSLSRLDADAEDRLDAVVVAAADLERLGRLDAAAELLSLADWPTAAGQGALAVEIAAGATADLRRRLVALDHRPSRLTALAERAVLERLGVSATAPVAATAMLDDGLLFLTATVYAPDGSDAVTASHAAYPEDSGDPAGELGERAAAELLQLGATDLLDPPR